MLIDMVYERVELLSCDVGVAQAPPIIHVYENTGMVFTGIIYSRSNITTGNVLTKSMHKHV